MPSLLLLQRCREACLIRRRIQRRRLHLQTQQQDERKRDAGAHAAISNGACVAGASRCTAAVGESRKRQARSDDEIRREIRRL